MPWTAMAAVGSMLGGLSGIFGRKKNPSPRDNIMSQAAGARDAAAAYGFNPLTMLQYGNPGGTGLGASAPPLASFDMLTQGFKEIGDITSGDADRRREQEDLKHELAKLEIERLRAGNASDALGGVSPLGNRAVATGSGNVRVSAGTGFDAPNAMFEGRKKEVDPLKNSPGGFEVENAITGGSITLPGDGDPWGIDELATAVVVGAPQVAKNWIARAGDAGLAAREKYKEQHGQTPRETADSWLSPLGIRYFSPVMTLDMDDFHARRKAKGLKP